MFHDECNRDLHQLLQMISDRSFPLKKIQENLKNYKGGRGVAPAVAKVVYSLTSRKVLTEVSEGDKEVAMDRFAEYLIEEGRKEAEEKYRKERKEWEEKHRQERKEREAKERKKEAHVVQKMYARGDDVATIAEILEKSPKQVEELLRFSEA